MNNRENQRQRRTRKTRARIRTLNIPKLSVFRSVKNLYVSLIMPDGRVLNTVSTISKDLKASLTGKPVEKAYILGKTVAEFAKKQGIDKVAFDRSGYKYHGRIAKIAEGARDAGLEF